MIKELKKESNYTTTENGALTNASTFSDCLDLFATAGALRHADDGEVIARVMRAYAESPELALKILFFARDVRGGLGERRFFRVALRCLADNAPHSVIKNIEYVPEFGRYDDLLALFGTECEAAALAYIKKAWDKDVAALDTERAEVTLLAKWLPSVNTSNADAVRAAKTVAKYLGLNDAQYRKTLTKLRARIKIIENNLRTRDYTFDYEKQPSGAMLKYRKAFMRNDGARYSEYLGRVAEGKAKMHTGTLTPYDIVYRCLDVLNISPAERKALDVTWNALPEFSCGNNALAVVDGSGSMYSWTSPSPAAVAQSLGIYLAEHAEGEYAGHFITFSKTPKLVEIKGKDIYEKVKYCASFNEVANTNIAAVFELILNTAVKNKLPQSELPSRLYIISDMEFDYCADGAELTNFEYAKAQYEANGYKLPELVFWNVDSRNTNQPVTMNDRGVILVSGFSPRIFDMVTGGNLSPYAYMLDVLNGERYACIKA